MKRESLLPEALLAEVVTALYSDADRLGWSTLPLRDRSRAYSAWVEDDRVGGILTGFMTPEAARAWIKDGPMKEYARATRGAGRYARFGRSGGTTADDVVKAALGPEAEVMTGSEGIKPFHCIAATDDRGRHFVAWGDGRNLRNLFWAGLRAAVEDGLPAHVVVMEPPGYTTPGEEVKRQAAFAERCGLELHYMREVLGTREETGP